MIGAALEGIDLTAVTAALLEQEAKGHTATSDARKRPICMASKVVELAQAARDVTIEGDRQNLDVAHRRAAVTAALAIALMRRIRIEQQKGSTNE